MKHKLIKLISIILIASLAWQNIAWACPNGFCSLRAVAFGERKSEKYILAENLNESARKHAKRVVDYFLLGAGFLLVTPARKFRFGPVWLYIALGGLFFGVSAYHYTRFVALTKRAETLLAKIQEPTIQVQDLGTTGVGGIKSPEGLRPLLSAI